MSKINFVDVNAFYDRPVLGICTFGNVYYLFCLQKNDSSEEDYYSFTALDANAMFHLLTNKKMLREIMSENATWFGYIDATQQELRKPVEEELPISGEYYTHSTNED